MRLNLRAMERRMAKLEQAGKPRPSPFAEWFGSFDAWVESKVLPDIESGVLDLDFIVIVGALRVWETDGTWERARAR